MMAYRPEDRLLPEELLEDSWFEPIEAVAEQQQVQTAQVQLPVAEVKQPAAAPKELPEREVIVMPTSAFQGAPPSGAAATAVSAEAVGAAGAAGPPV